MRYRMTAILLGLFLAIPSFAHQGHDAPGALPVAPHGGKVKEATMPHGKKGASEIFIEVTYENKKITVYPLTLTSDNKDFAAASSSDFSDIKVRVKTSKGEKKLNFQDSNTLEAPFDSQGLNWFDVYVSVKHKNEPKEAKIHFEFN